MSIFHHILKPISDRFTKMTDLFEQILPHIKNSIYPFRSTLFDWKMKEGDHPEAISPSLNDRSWTSIRIPFLWGKFNRIFWFRHTFTITPEFAGKPLVMLFDFPEALLFLNGKPHHGIDQHHQEVRFTEKAKLNEQFTVAIQAYSGRKQDHDTFARADLAVLDSTARRLASGLLVLQELFKLMEHGSQESKDIHELIHNTLIYLKYFRPGSEEYPNAIRRAYNFLLNTLETDYKTTLPGLIHLIGQSHVDSAWLWRSEEAIRKCGHTFSSVLRLMEEFPECKFSQGQAIFYELIKAKYPDIYKQIKQSVVEGRWEPMGSTWLEPDCNIPNGESLIRQIVFGKRFFKQEFGIDSDIFWIPDSSGFCWALPQILNKSGIKYFYTSKLASNDTTVFPFISFWWQGIDGSKILSHLSPVGLEAQITPEFLMKSGKAAQQQPSATPILQTFGYGNGGGGPTKENLELAVVLKTIIGLPSSKLSTAQEFFKQLEEQSADVPTWNNELYLEAHRGTYTTQAWIKKENRQTERLLYNTELLSTLAMIFGKKASARRYPQNEIEQAWKKLLLNQSHTVVSGAAIADVYKDSQQDFQTIREHCLSIIDNCVNGISLPSKKSKKEFSFTIFNPLGWTRNEYVELFVKSKEKNFTVTDSQQNAVAYQIVEKTKQGINILCYVQNIPAFGFKNVVVKVSPASGSTAEQWKTSAHSLESPFFKIRLDNKGLFSSIYTKHLRRELIQKGKRCNIFQTYHDASKQWEGWNIDADYEKHRTEVWKFKQMKFVERGPLRATIRLEFRSEHGSTLIQNVRFYHQLARIDFQTSVRWLERQTLMKVAFPFNFKKLTTTYEIQGGAIHRTSKPSTEWENAKFEVPAQQWADMSDTKFGVSLLNDCKYGYDAREATLRLTLLRSPHYPHPVEPWLADTELTDQGDHGFCYSLYPHSGDWAGGKTVHAAHELNNPMLIVPNMTVDNLPTLIENLKPNIIIDAIKKAESSSDIIVRMHEAHGISTDAVAHFGIDMKVAVECDLLENDQKPLKIQKGTLPLKFKPFEIKTVRLTPKPLKRKK